MNDDDELRRRLHDIPTPGVRLDADAVLAGAKRRRRPKTIALSSAATVAGVLLFAPLVAPGIEALRPSSGVSVDYGAAPNSAPESSSSGADGGTGADGDSGASGDTGASDADGQPDAAPEEAGSGEASSSEGGANEGGTNENSAGAAGEPPLCGLPRAGDVGLVLTFAERPVGATPVEVRVSGDGDARITAVAIDSFAIVDHAARVEPGEPREEFALGAGDSAALTVATATLEPGACGNGLPAAITPVAIVGVDGAEPVAVVGSSWQ